MEKQQDESQDVFVAHELSSSYAIEIKQKTKHAQLSYDCVERTESTQLFSVHCVSTPAVNTPNEGVLVEAITTVAGVVVAFNTGPLYT